MEAVIIGNPNSGSAGDEGYLERFAEILRAGGLKVGVLNTERPDHARELAAMAGDRLVIAAGGDGTVNEVVNGLSKGATLGILPLGTANVLTWELGLPLKPEDACDRILSGTGSLIDVGVSTDQEGTERRFACMAGIGFDASVVREVTPRFKWYLRSLAFPLVALKVYFRGGLPDLRLITGQTIYVGQLAVIANGPYYGGAFKVAEDTSLTSGKLEVVLVEKVGRLLRADILAHVLARRPLNRAAESSPVQDIRAESIGRAWCSRTDRRRALGPPADVLPHRIRGHKGDQVARSDRDTVDVSRGYVRNLVPRALPGVRASSCA